MLPFVFDGVAFESEADVDARAMFLSGLEPQQYDCCVESCCCFVGPHEQLDACPYCGERRLNADGKPRKQFTYVPIIPRLLAMCANPTLAKAMKYRGDFEAKPRQHAPGSPECEQLRQRSGLGQPGQCYCPSQVSDVFDGHHYQALRDTFMKLGGVAQIFKFFSDPRSIALALSTDGFTPFKCGKQTCAGRSYYTT